MSKRRELNSYIAGLQQRLRLGAWLRGAAVFTGAALIVTIALVLVLNHFAFPAHGVIGARWVLVIALAAAAWVGIALPLFCLTRARTVRQAEAAHPDFEQRLTTFYEGERKSVASLPADPFLELLAADTLAMTQHAEPSSLVPDNRLFALGGAGVACLGVLVWMIAAGPGYLGYGASLLWTGAAKNAAPLYTLAVTPGNVAVRRNSDELIAAHVSGMRPDKVQLFAHFQSAAGWEPVAMQAQPDAGGAATYQFVFAGLPENVEYYVAAGPLVSPHYKVRVVDLPSVKEIHVIYHYPKWTGMKPVSEEHSGDLRAIEGTDAAIEVEMDHPLKDGQLMLDGGQTIQLAGGQGNKYQGSIRMEKDGAYHVAATDEGQQVRLSEDYFIATDKAQPPQISIIRPGGEYRASPIEEVTVGVKAADQFGLNDMHLHYSVNGGPDRDISMLKEPGAKSADGSHTLPLEDFKLMPGDLVSLYATAKDGHLEARTGISFVQVEPFERAFSQSQQGGGEGDSGGGNNKQTEISKREKELIAATWKQENNKDATQKDAAAAGQFLSDAQQKLRDQVMALSARMQSRDLSQANEEFTGFDKDMQMAAAAMTPSAEKLQGMQWKDAIPLEQKALQALLRAEATIRQIEVAFGERGGGGGGGTDSAGRDLASLFDLELDTEKNQYETAQSASPAEQHEKDVEDALEKLDALAKRQEELANQQHNSQQSFQERWQQEMLRREAEQLQRQMEQLAKNGQQGQQGSSGSQSDQPGSQQEQSSSQSGAQGQRGAQSSRQRAGSQSNGSSSGQSADSTDERIEQALNRLRQAGHAMKRSDGPQQSNDAARRAADELHEATNLLAGSQQQLASNKLGSLTREAGRLTEQERAQADRIEKLAKADHQADPNQTDLADMMARRQELDRLAQERQQLSDDLSNLQKNLRDTARETAPNEPGVAQKLRDALTEMDESDLDNHLQRTADWLRSGINPNSNGTESEIAQGLQKLSQQLQQAQQGMGKDKPGSRATAGGDETAALDQIERLRSQIEAMTSLRGGNRTNGMNGQGGPAQNGQQSGQQPGNGNRQEATGQQLGRDGPSGQQVGTLSREPGGSLGQRGGQGIQRSGGLGGQSGQNGEVRSGGGRGADGTAWNNVNTGNNSYGQPAQRSDSPDRSSNPVDTDQMYQQGMRNLNQLRHIIQGDPQAAKEVAELARQMQQLDPSRFPGNPAMVEQMHREVLSSVDHLELELQRDGASTEARTGKPYAVPAGYRDSVAEYYRRLSRNP
jgi:hypothetical protein